MTTVNPQPKMRPELLQMLKLPSERILSIGVTGSGKTYQWLSMAKKLLPLGIKFRAVDTDNDVNYMLCTQFPECIPENGGNVYVFPAYDWIEYEKSIKWVKQAGLTPEQLNILSPSLKKAYTTPIMPYDWVVLDKSNNAWSRVQDYFVSQVFGESMGEYFLEIRKSLWANNDIGKGGKKVTSTALEALDGWKDWTVINKLYDDFINPIIYQVRCHVYTTADVDKLDKKLEKDPEVLNLFGDLDVKPAGQKRIGGQMHSIFLYIPGKERWSIMTLKDRSGRAYFQKTPLLDFYTQYLFAKASWPMVEEKGSV